MGCREEITRASLFRYLFLFFYAYCGGKAIGHDESSRCYSYLDFRAWPSSPFLHAIILPAPPDKKEAQRPLKAIAKDLVLFIIGTLLLIKASNVKKEHRIYILSSLVVFFLV